MSHRRFSGEWWGTYAPAFAVGAAVVLAVLLVRFYYVPTESMDPLIKPGARIAAIVVPPWSRDSIGRGDVVVFSSEGEVPGNPGVDTLVKRVVAVGGDRVVVSDGVLLVNGKASEWQGSTPNVGYYSSTVPEGSYFMMGDNRLFSIDSRFFGAIPERRVIGRATLVYMPYARVIK